MSLKKHSACPKCKKPLSLFGFYIRKSDSHRVRRFYCFSCKKSFSNSSLSLCYRQKKRQINPSVFKLLCSGLSQRRIALYLGVSRTTVHRKFEFLSAYAKAQNKAFLAQIIKEEKKPSEVYLDEMEDKIHTKCKPVSIALAVTQERKILLHKVSRMRPKNRDLNRVSKKKYPEWINESHLGFREFLVELLPVLPEKICILSDEKSIYSEEIQKHIPKCEHQRFKSRRAVVAGQGELKEGGWDPLFPLNHTCAMLRANINRLIRRTWCTSKKIESLSQHIELYTYFHNNVLTA